MAQTFRYPNLIAGTDQWTDWWTPEVGMDNRCMVLGWVDFGRPLVVGDVVTLHAEVEFDKLDLTGNKAILVTQGTTAFDDGKTTWRYNDPLCPYTRDFFFPHRGAVFDGAEAMSLRNVIAEKNGVIDGKGLRYAELGFRCNYSGGGRSVCGVSWSSSARRAHRTHGHRQKGRCGLSE